MCYNIWKKKGLTYWIWKIKNAKNNFPITDSGIAPATWILSSLVGLNYPTRTQLKKKFEKNNKGVVIASRVNKVKLI